MTRDRRRKRLEIEIPATPPEVPVSMPSIGSQVILDQPVKVRGAVIPAGTQVMVVGHAGDSYKVEYRGRYYWI